MKVLLASDGDATGGRVERTLPQRPWFVVVLAAVAAAAVYVQVSYVAVRTPVFGLLENKADLGVYRAGARHLLHGLPIYDRPVLGRFDYTYPPFSTIVLQPIAWVSRSAAINLWTALIVVALLFVVYASFRALGYRRDWRLVVLAASVTTVAMVLEPVRTTIWYGQINVFLMAIVMADLLRPGRSRLRGWAIGVAAGIKLTPGFFVVFLLVTRQWKAAATAVAAGVVTVAVGAAVIPRQSWMFWSDKVFDSQRVGDVRNPANQSLRGAVAHVLGTASPPTVLWLASCVVAAALGLAAAVLAHRDGNEVLALSLTGMTTTAVSPFSWGHHWVWFVPLLVVLVDLVLRRWSRGAHAVAVTLALLPVALVLATFMWKYFVPEGAMGFRPFFGFGVFMNPVPDWLRWFGAQPYLWVFAVASVATVVTHLIGIRRRRGVDPTAPVDGTVGARPAVGDRR